MKLASAAFLLIALVSVASAQTTAPLGPGSGGGPGGGGGGASPAGATGTVQYNAGGGLFGGITNWKTSGTNDLTGSSGSTLAVNGCTIGSYAMCTGGTSNLIGAVTLGAQQTTQGSLVLSNTAAGAFATTLQSSNSATAAYTITLPVSAPVGNGYALTATTGGVGSWSNIVSSPCSAFGTTAGTCAQGNAFLPLAGGTLTGTETISSASLILSGNQSAAAWTTSGIRYVNPAVSYTDTSSSGTVATAYTDLFGTSTILASNATVYTNYFGTYFVNPVASTNVTMTNKFALGADSLNVANGGQSSTSYVAQFGGQIYSGSITTSGNINLSSGTGALIEAGGRTLLSENVSGSTQLQNPGGLTGNVYVFANSGFVQLGAVNTSGATAPSAQTLQAQSSAGGASATNIAGANWTVIGSLGTGTGPSGNVLFEVGKTGTTGTVQNTAYPLLSLNAGNATGATIQFGDGTNFTTYDSCTALTTGATGIIACTASDERLKDEIAVLDSQEALAFAELVPAKIYNFRDPHHAFSDDRRHIGFMAQDIKRLAPNIASAMVGRTAPTDETPDGTLTVDYSDAGPIALAAIRQLAKKVEQLEQRIR